MKIIARAILPDKANKIILERCCSLPHSSRAFFQGSKTTGYQSLMKLLSDGHGWSPHLYDSSILAWLPFSSLVTRIFCGMLSSSLSTCEMIPTSLSPADS